MSNKKPKWYVTSQVIPSSLYGITVVQLYFKLCTEQNASTNVAEGMERKEDKEYIEYMTNRAKTLIDKYGNSTYYEPTYKKEFTLQTQRNLDENPSKFYSMSVKDIGLCPEVLAALSKIYKLGYTSAINVIPDIKAQFLQYDSVADCYVLDEMPKYLSDHV